MDLAAATAHHIVVMNTPGQNANAVAELVIGLLIYACRNKFNGTSGTELMGKKLGLLAFGAVAQNLARIAHGMGMDISSYSPLNRPQKIIDAGFHVHESLHDLFSFNNIVSLHIPATPDTKQSINHDLVNRMPKGGILVNTARKEVIHEDELIQLMQERADLKYITDIMPAADMKFRTLFEGRYFATPKKMGAQTAEANINAGIAAAKQIVDFIENGNTRFQVNK